MTNEEETRVASRIAIEEHPKQEMDNYEKKEKNQTS